MVCYVCGKEIDPFYETLVLVFDDDEEYYECESCHQYCHGEVIAE